MICPACQKMESWLKQMDLDRRMVRKDNRSALGHAKKMRVRIAEAKGWRWPPRGRHGKTSDMNKILPLPAGAGGRPSKTGPVTAHVVSWIEDWVEAHRRLDLAGHVRLDEARMREAMKVAEEASRLSDSDYYRRAQAISYLVLAALLECSTSAVRKAHANDLERLSEPEELSGDEELVDNSSWRRLVKALHKPDIDSYKSRLDPGPLTQDDPVAETTESAPTTTEVTPEVIARASRMLFEDEQDE